MGNGNSKEVKKEKTLAETAYKEYIPTKVPGLNNIVEDYDKWESYGKAVLLWGNANWCGQEVQFLIDLGMLNKIWKEKHKKYNDPEVVKRMNAIENDCDKHKVNCDTRSRSLLHVYRFDKHWQPIFELQGTNTLPSHAGAFRDAYATVLNKVNGVLTAVGQEFVKSIYYKEWYTENKRFMKSWHTKGKDEWLHDHYDKLYPGDSHAKKTAKIDYIDSLNDDNSYSSSAFLYSNPSSIHRDYYGNEAQLLSGNYMMDPLDNNHNGLLLVMGICLTLMFGIFCGIIGAISGVVVAVITFVSSKVMHWKIREEIDEEMDHV